MTEKDPFERGLEVRRAVLGDEYVDQQVQMRDELGGRFQDLITRFVWNEVWGHEGLSRKHRGLINLALLAAANRGAEFDLHVAGAVRNGATVEELRETMVQVAAYAGFPAAVEGLRRMRLVLADINPGLLTGEDPEESPPAPPQT